MKNLLVAVLFCSVACSARAGLAEKLWQWYADHGMSNVEVVVVAVDLKPAPPPVPQPSDLALIDETSAVSNYTAFALNQQADLNQATKLFRATELEQNARLNTLGRANQALGDLIQSLHRTVAVSNAVAAVSNAVNNVIMSPAQFQQAVTDRYKSLP